MLNSDTWTAQQRAEDENNTCLMGLSEEDEAAHKKIQNAVQSLTTLRDSADRLLSEFMELIRQKQGNSSARELEEELSDWILHGLSQVDAHVRHSIKKLLNQKLTRLQQYEVKVTFDPDTAHPNLILSDDRTQVRLGDQKQKVPEIPERFSDCIYLLGKQDFNSGRFYFEVDVKGKTRWVIGVAKDSIQRKGHIKNNPGFGNWTLRYRDGEYATVPQEHLHLKTELQRVGVFVDYDDGVVSFHDGKTGAHIYSYTGCGFKERLYPYFCPGLNKDGKNSAPLIIVPAKKATPQQSHIRGTLHRMVSKLFTRK